MLAENKVVKLNVTQIYDQINKFLTKHSYNSAKTKEAYEADIRMFFRIMKKKEIEHLNVEDVQITLDDFEDFIEKLYSASSNGEKAYANKTINRKVSAVKGLIEYLAAKKIVNDISFLSLVKSLPETSKHHGVLESHEVFQMAELALEETHKGNIKRLAILFSYDTCSRRNEVLNMKWSNFIEKDNVVLVEGIGKGNKEFRQSISKDFYNDLLSLKVEGSDKVFDVTEKNLTDMMKRLLIKMNIPEERGIVFHSLRKAGATYRYRVTGDVLEVKRSLNHTNLNTTQLYIEQQNYGEAIGGVSSGGKINHNLYKEVDKETLVQVIEMCNKDLQLLINMKLKEIVDEIQD